MSAKYISPYTPLLYRKTGVGRGKPIFLIFDLKHRLRVLVRTASLRRFYHVSTINVSNKYIENIFSMKFSFF